MLEEARKELIALTLLGRGDFNHSYQRRTALTALTMTGARALGKLARD